MLTFGPVPSRRLGRSIGINSIPPKICSYACVYCQIGRTTKFLAERSNYFEPEEIAKALEERLDKVRESGDSVDYVTFVPDGEPTLDERLSEAHRLVKALGVPTAIITNGSLMGRDDVRRDLMDFDLVSIKVDSVIPEVWLHVDRPHPDLDLGGILKGSLAFAKEYKGRLLTETMLVQGINDGEQNLQSTASHIGKMIPCCAYISIPTRPPMEKWVKSPSADALARAYSIFSGYMGPVELLTGYEGNAFASTGDPEADILDISAVHPMRKDAVEELLARTDAEWSLIENLLETGKIRKANWNGQDYFIRTPAVER
jgi:wyosine [tRNA(Phe)-imidazoG37] synthetase (radical SAM superfamily)